MYQVGLEDAGFIVAKFGLPYAPPLTFLLLRCLVSWAIYFFSPSWLSSLRASTPVESFCEVVRMVGMVFSLS